MYILSFSQEVHVDDYLLQITKCPGITVLPKPLMKTSYIKVETAQAIFQHPSSTYSPAKSSPGPPGC